jgi:hypothetical protein
VKPSDPTKNRADAFDQWWAQKPLTNPLTIPAELHEAVMELSPDDRRDREKVNAAVNAKKTRHP